ncbi:MAG: AI-2E family transporter [Propionibacteriaceae bacterium]|nr:AI-2E family transporter [Propionibacteriaceae bacterium]
MTNPDTPKATSPGDVRMPPPSPLRPVSVAVAGLPRYVTIMLGVAVTLGVVLLMHQFAGVIGPVFMAMNLIIAAYPIHTWLRGKGTPGWLSASVMVLAVIVILLAMFVAMVWSVSSMVAVLPNYQNEYTSLYNTAVHLMQNYGINTTGMSDIRNQISPSSVANVLLQAFSSAYGIAAVLITIIASLIFLAMDAPGLRARMRIASSDFPQLGHALAEFSSGVRRYWVTTTIFGAIIAVLDGVALFFLGVPLAVVWALLSFLTNYIPNIGFVIGLIPPALLALLGGGWKLMLIVIAIYCVLNFVIQAIIAPRIIGESVGVTPTVSFVSLLLWGWVLGAIGTLVALPMTLLLKSLFVDSDPGAHWLGALISSDLKDVQNRPKARGA